jgi:hypothetical protein
MSHRGEGDDDETGQAATGVGRNGCGPKLSCGSDIEVWITRGIFDQKYPILWYADGQGSGRFFLERNFITRYSLFSRLQIPGKINIFSILRGFRSRGAGLGCYINFSGHPKQSFPSH